MRICIECGQRWWRLSSWRRHGKGPHWWRPLIKRMPPIAGSGYLAAKDIRIGTAVGPIMFLRKGVR